MITIDVLKQSNYPVSSKVIKERVRKIFEDNGIVSDSQASVAVVGEARMLELVKTYLHETGELAAEHPVLSFPTSEMEGPFVFPPDNILYLGEIVVSYPKSVEYAKAQNKLVEDVVCELAEHGALHLIGVHHD